MARLAYGLAYAITSISPAYVHVIRSKYDIDSGKILVVKAGVSHSWVLDVERNGNLCQSCCCWLTFAESNGLYETYSEACHRT